MTTLTVLHVVAGLHPSSGGPSRTVVQLTNCLAKHSAIAVALVSQKYPGDLTVPSAGNVERSIVESPSRLALQFGLPVRRELKRIAQTHPPALIHSHGLWTPVNHWATIAARRRDTPLIVHPRGMLEPWALNHKAFKKRVALALFQRRDLVGAQLLVATSNAEFQNIRKLGLKMPVAIIPNGVVLSADAPTEIGARPGGLRVALFLSRVHPVKGLMNLIRAWKKLNPAGWRLCIAGPDEAGHLKEVFALVTQLGVQDTVDYVGAVDGAAKSALYNAADIFVLPTFTENFGLVVAEALTHSLPVITTRGAPWADLQSYGCGWWVDIGVEPLVSALREAMALGDDERRAMGARGRDYVRRYDWDGIAQQTIDVYRWVLGQGPLPDCVRTD